jgi:hypothetical protein
MFPIMIRRIPKIAMGIAPVPIDNPVINDPAKISISPKILFNIPPLFYDYFNLSPFIRIHGVRIIQILFPAF